MDDIVIVESKDFAQVLFDDVQECYTENKDLICYFSLNEFLEYDKNDLIGVFKVGFTKSKDYHVALNINLNDINENNKGKLLFSADKLPKDDGEFYQFVYMSMGKQIRGASLPFQFKRPHLTDYVEVDEQESVVLKLKENEMNETLSDLKHKCSNLSQANETYEKLIKENESSILLLRDEIACIKLRCMRLQTENNKLNFAMQSKNDTNKTIIGHFAKLEKQLDERLDEVSKLTSELKQKESLVLEQTQTIQTILAERDSLNSLIEKLTKEKSTLEVERETISQELIMSKDKLMAVEQCKEVLHAQLAIATSELEAANKKMKEFQDDLNSLTEKDKAYEYEKIEALEKLNKMKEEYENKLEESNGIRYALNLAHRNVETRMKNMQMRYEKEHKEHKDLIETLKNENENLKQRIRTGAYEYSYLANKYLKLKNSCASNSLITSSASSIAVSDFLSDFKKLDLQKQKQKYHHKYEDDSLLQEDTISDIEKNNNNNHDDATIIDENLSIYSINLKPQQQQQQQKLKEKKLSESTISTNTTNSTAAITQSQIIDKEDENRMTESPFQHINDDDLKVDDNNNLIEQAYETETTASECSGQCEICGFVYPQDLDVFAIEMHMSTHYGPSCPICFFTFRKGYPQEDFESHVNNHFTC